MLGALEGVLDGRDGPLVPVPAGDLRESDLLTTSLRIGEEIDDEIALVISTSGTTGAPKGAMLTAAALIAGASATHDRLGGPGTWLLALPTYH
ncbi:MAG: AMP-binding protein, partial [Mycobacterium sp.]|nr:AMP-binding protein [Mycobacterium sp.]